MKINERLNHFEKISKKLAALGEPEITDLLHDALDLHTGIGGESQLLVIRDTGNFKAKVFVKKVTISDTELLARHDRSTANFFDMPIFCQYGIGSPGFGAWRELAAHLTVNDWVANGECSGFPLLYHWRILPAKAPPPLDISPWTNVNDFVKYWDNSDTLRKRVEAVNSASHQLLLFLEYIPQTLYSWLSKALKQADRAATAIAMVEENIDTVSRFMNANNFVHFDAHFENILTDGEQVFLSDFGLTSNKSFDLSTDELLFLDKHANYDRLCMGANLVHCVIAHTHGKERWQKTLRDILEGDGHSLSAPFAAVINRYGPATLVLDEFYKELRRGPKSLVYPAEKFDQLLVAASTNQG